MKTLVLLLYLCSLNLFAIKPSGIIKVKSCGKKSICFYEGKNETKYFCEAMFDDSCPDFKDCKRHSLKSHSVPIGQVFSIKAIQSYDYSNEINILRSRRKVMQEANLERVVAMAHYESSTKRLNNALSGLVLTSSMNKSKIGASTSERRNFASKLYHQTFLNYGDYIDLKNNLYYEKQYVYGKLQGEKDLLNMYDEYFRSTEKELTKIGATLKERLEESRKAEEAWNKLLIEKNIEFLDYQFLSDDFEDALRNMKRSPDLTSIADDFWFKKEGIKKIKGLIRQADLSLHLLENRSKLIKQKCQNLTNERSKKKCEKVKEVTNEIYTFQKKKVFSLKDKYKNCYLPIIYSEEARADNELIDKCIPPTKKQFLSLDKSNGNMFFSILSPIEGGDTGKSPGDAAGEDARAVCGVACESRLNGDDQGSDGDSGSDSNEERNVKGTDVEWAVYRDKETGNAIGRFKAEGKMHDTIKKEHASFLREYDRLRREIGAERAIGRIRVDRDFTDRLDNLSKNVDDVQRRTGDAALLTLKREIDATKQEKDFWNKEIAKDTKSLVSNNDVVLKSISNISSRVHVPKDINPTESDFAATAVDLSMSLSVGIIWDAPTVVWALITGKNIVGQSVTSFEILMYSLGAILPGIDGAVAKHLGKAAKVFSKMSKGMVSKVKSLFDVAPKLTVEILAGWDKPGKIIEGILSTVKKLRLREKYQVQDFVEWAGDNLKTIAGNQRGSFGDLVGKYKPAPTKPKAFKNLKLEKRKTKSSGGGLRKRWKDKKGNIYEWDSQHGRLEKYNKRGRHLGEFDPETGALTKPANPTRKVEP